MSHLTAHVGIESSGLRLPRLGLLGRIGLPRHLCLVAALEGRARDESRKRDAETDALHAKLDRLLAALDAKG